ncbi:MAG: hypothetical protein HY549_05675 [Elusimicrobia bacterium]|nr:hypothetical protein [Elusimicrobiota bacterium]
MQLLNRYFTPFALLLILSAVYFSEPDPRDLKLSLGILACSMIVNWWLAANAYRLIHWARQMKALQVWLNFIWAVPLFYLLQPYWGPMWLLFVMAPATAALYYGRGHTLLTALVSSGTMLAIYYDRGVFSHGPAGGMAFVHACFIIVFSLFVYSLAQTALRLRDAALR